jgi:hypothetical protein
MSACDGYSQLDVVTQLRQSVLHIVLAALDCEVNFHTGLHFTFRSITPADDIRLDRNRLRHTMERQITSHGV